ncbi:GNAT family N-acetyltransferase [Chryseobacterium sp. NKUCC03_KSP]|uniref:GNAT family N-acetyltransferase n=1 Tax=Chryseobacterium sp. NKUCC03_KSP TaxID=2842125 RepID=UPI001C5AD4E0|nr:GNAT family N-acetyltransferase [Chryseobacterium sp. NKUCC03_KSP]MBW3522303.1 GNAT family N-acetyltransferase [Chryseobacterium sp. NKUCC03_KSP]
MEIIEIKKVTLGDIEDLQKIGKQTFFETFAESNTPENMNKYLEDSFSVKKLSEEFSNEYSEFYFALSNGEVIGYMKLNTGGSQTEAQQKESSEIERIYVLQDYHGKKVGQLLYEKAIQIAMKRRSEYVWLGVWEKNTRAISFYKKNDFVEFDKHIFVLGDDAQTDIMMKKML